jgi:hypothetical protein
VPGAFREAIVVHGSTWTARLAAAAMLLTVTACGTGVVAEPQAAPVTLPADQLIFLVESGGGYVTAVNAALESPQLAVYGDGRVIRFDNHRDGDQIPVGYTIAKVDPRLVLRFAAQTEALGLIEKRTDFGAPQVADLPYTTVRLHGAGVMRSVRIYALGEELGSGVSATQGKARRELSAVIDRARALPDGAARTPYRPSQVRVFGLDHASDAGRGPKWPGPAPDSFMGSSEEFGACGTLSGSAAELVYRAARRNPDANWTVGATQRTLAVSALLPGTIGCPP